MTDKQKIQAINSIVTQAYEWEPTEPAVRGPFFEGVIASIFAILLMEGEDNA